MRHGIVVLPGHGGVGLHRQDKGLKQSWSWGMVTVIRGGIVVVRCALALGVALRFAKSVVPSTAPRTPPTTRSTTKTATRPATTTPDRMGALSIKSLLQIKIFYRRIRE